MITTLVKVGNKLIDVDKIISVTPIKSELMFIVALESSKEVWLTPDDFQSLLKELKKVKRKLKTQLIIENRKPI